MAVGDYDGVSGQDLAVINRLSDNVTVLLADGSGGFNTAAGNPFSVGDRPAEIAHGDFDHDGSLDLAVANFENNPNVSVLLNDGSGGYLPQTKFSSVTGAQGIAVADFNADSDLDLAVTSCTTASRSCSATGPGVSPRPRTSPSAPAPPESWLPTSTVTAARTWPLRTEVRTTCPSC